MRKTKIINLRTTEPEYIALSTLAERMGVKKSVLLNQGLQYVLGTKTSEQKVLEPLILDQSQTKAMAQLLYMMGQSRIANNLNQIAKAVNTGTLILCPDVYQQIDESYRMHQWMRRTLIHALGLRSS